MPKRSETSFTDAFVRAAKAKGGKRTAYYDGSTPGLELRVSPAGVKSWSYRYRDIAARTVRLVLGSFPSMPLKEAREAALNARLTVSKGGDPQRDKQAAAAAARAQKIRTVRDLATSFLTAAEGRNRESSVAVDRQRINTHIIPKLGNQQITAVTRAQVRELIKEIGDRGQGVTANRVGAVVVRLFKYARDSLDLPVANPGAGLQSTFEETSRARVLTAAELRAVWNAIDKPPFTPMTESMALCLQTVALTLQRGREVVGINRNELDLDQRIWVIPGARTKNHRDHVVPLSPEAIKVIKRAIALIPRDDRGRLPASGPLFPSPRNPAKPITRHALTRAMTRLCDTLKIEDAGPHDLRRTGATNITGERIGLPRFVVSAVLNHVSEMGGVTAIYDRNEYLPEKRKALEAWAKLLVSVAKKRERTGGAR